MKGKRGSMHRMKRQQVKRILVAVLILVTVIGCVDQAPTEEVYSTPEGVLDESEGEENSGEVLVEAPEESSSIPWGAMYTPNEYLTYKGMTGAVKYYRGLRGAQQMITDLKVAQTNSIKLIVTLGSVDPQQYLDENRNIDMERVHAELDFFFDIQSEIQPFINNGTIWGIRFMDEPHDPSGFPHDFEIDPVQLGDVYSLIKSHFPHVRVGSTSPAVYMVKVPHADYAFGQYNHAHPPPSYNDPVQFFADDSRLAFNHGLDYVASINANTNTVDNYGFFESYKQICFIETVDFVTSWQWPQGHYLYPSFEARINDPDPEVQGIIAELPSACNR